MYDQEYIIFYLLYHSGCQALSNGSNIRFISD